MSILRNAIKDEIKRRRVTEYAFARDFPGVHRITILKWLYSGRRISIDMVERLLKELDLIVVPRSRRSNGKAKAKSKAKTNES